MHSKLFSTHLCTNLSRKTISEMRGTDTVTKNSNSSVTVQHKVTCDSGKSYSNDITFTVSNNSKTLEVKNATNNGYLRYQVTCAF